MMGIIHIYISEKEYDMFVNLLEQVSHGTKDDDGNILTMIKLDENMFNSLLGFCKKLAK